MQTITSRVNRKLIHWIEYVYTVTLNGQYQLFITRYGTVAKSATLLAFVCLFVRPSVFLYVGYVSRKSWLDFGRLQLASGSRVSVSITARVRFTTLCQHRCGVAEVCAVPSALQLSLHWRWLMIKHAHGCDVVSGCVVVVPASAAAVLVDSIVLGCVVLSCVPVLDARVPDVVLGPQIPASMSSVSATEIKCLPAAPLCPLPDFIAYYHPHHTTTTVSRSFFRDHPGEPAPEENFWTLWCKGRLTEETHRPSVWAPLRPD